MFEEGSFGREFFIVNEGRVGVYKAGPDKEVELAQIEKGGVVGEMSVLDSMPRSATVRAVEPTKLLVVNEFTFQSALSAVPVWLTSIIKIMVSRLRDANRRVDQSVLRDKLRGLCSLILLLLSSKKHEFASSITLDYDLVLAESYYVCRLKKKETAKMLSGLEQRKLLTVTQDANHKNHICLSDVEAILLFEEYLFLKSQRKSFKEINIPEDSVALLSNIVYVAQKSGIETDEGTTLQTAVLQNDLDSKNTDNLQKNLLDLQRRNLVSVMPSDAGEVVLFRQGRLVRVKKIREWMPRFEMETP